MKTKTTIRDIAVAGFAGAYIALMHVAITVHTAAGALFGLVSLLLYGVYAVIRAAAPMVFVVGLLYVILAGLAHVLDAVDRSAAASILATLWFLAAAVAIHARTCGKRGL